MKNTYNVFGITLFSWENWDEINESCLQFYNCNFPPELFEFSEYDECNVAIFDDGTMEIYSSNNELIFNDYWIKIPYFNKLIKTMY